ncbi:MAG TPA: alcohol dehydrogenase catalytic domain-containing protein [Phycisphaerae bacterium]|nr:alcohol dehydrogenase catalytic domain-containing protein [Phycisphaerae bacterium]
MRKAYLTGIREIELREVPDPKIERGDDVRVRMHTIGVCGSDLHYYREGKIGVQVVEFPFAVGHECSGTVVEVGPDVANLRVGQRVAIDPLVVCGRCDQCLAGRENTCRNQKFLGCPGQIEGSMADYLVMPARCVFAIPDNVTFDQAVMVEPFAIGLWAQRLAGPTEGRKIAILGSGPIGLCVLQAVKAAGNCTVYATDLLDERVALARRTGADWGGNPDRQDVVAAIGEAEPDGLDLVFECAGKQETIDQAGLLLTPGGTLLVLGIPPESRLSFDMNYFRRRELRVQSVRRQNGCVEDAIEMVASGKVDLDPQITHHFTLAESQAAFDLVADYKDGVIKAMIHVED